MPVPTYCFYITTNDGETTKWINLSEIQAFRMWRTTNRNVPSNVAKYGWGIQPNKEEIKASGGKGKYESPD